MFSIDTSTEVHHDKKKHDKTLNHRESHQCIVLNKVTEKELPAQEDYYDSYEEFDP
jgi:hypothetical protein